MAEDYRTDGVQETETVNLDELLERYFAAEHECDECIHSGSSDRMNCDRCATMINAKNALHEGLNELLREKGREEAG